MKRHTEEYDKYISRTEIIERLKLFVGVITRKSQEYRDAFNSFVFIVYNCKTYEENEGRYE